MPARFIVTASGMPAACAASNSECRMTPWAPTARDSTSRSSISASKPAAPLTIRSTRVASISRVSALTRPLRWLTWISSPGRRMRRWRAASPSPVMAPRSARLRLWRRNSCSSVSLRATTIPRRVCAAASPVASGSTGAARARGRSGGSASRGGSPGAKPTSPGYGCRSTTTTAPHSASVRPPTNRGRRRARLSGVSCTMSL